MSTGKVIATARGRRWLESGHPWLFADDVAEGGGEAGSVVQVLDREGAELGWGQLSTRSKIAVRLVARGGAAPDREFWRARLSEALERRARHGLLEARGACRLIGGDADGFPGLVVDRYRDVLVFQCGTAGADRLRDPLLELFDELLPFPVRAALDRSTSAARRLEELPERSEWMRGRVTEPLAIDEPPGLVYEVDLEGGHKTGHYLDQRLNRVEAARHAAGRRVLDAFCFDGLFGIRAALAGAEAVVCLDESEPALARARRNAELNGVGARLSFERGDAMKDLRRRAEAPLDGQPVGGRYGLVIVDPPAFARNRREVEGAIRGYRELNRRALALVEPGGLLVSASCSYNMRPEAFVAVLGEAAARAGRTAHLEALRGAAPDHPVRLGLTESWYLKCAFVRVT